MDIWEEFERRFEAGEFDDNVTGLAELIYTILSVPTVVTGIGTAWGPLTFKIDGEE